MAVQAQGSAENLQDELGENGDLKSKRTARSGIPDKDLETDSDDIVVDSSDMTSMNNSQAAEEMAEEFIEMNYSQKRDEEQINYDHY